MTKSEYIESLKNALINANVSDIENRLSFYEEMIDDRIEDGLNEETAVSGMESVSSIVNSVVLEKPVSALVAQKVKDSKKEAEKNGYGALWIILAIIGFPVWFPLILTFFILLLIFYFVFAILIGSFFIVDIALGLSGLACLVAPFSSIFSFYGLPMLACLGIAGIMIGLCMLLFKPLLELSKLFIKLFNACIIKIKSLFIRR